jgi:hypothetical protein
MGALMPDYPQYVRDIIKAAASGDVFAGQVLRYLSSTPEERDVMLRASRAAYEARAADERPDR